MEDSIEMGNAEMFYVKEIVIHEGLIIMELTDETLVYFSEEPLLWARGKREEKDLVVKFKGLRSMRLCFKSEADRDLGASALAEYVRG